jgi:outer membrane lipoprotein-sorting protein
MSRRYPVALLALSLLAGCNQPQPAPANGSVDAAPAGTAAAAPQAAEPGLLTALNPLSSPLDDIKASMQGFLGVKSFHATMKMSGTGAPEGMTTEMDFVAPDRYRMQMPMGTQVIIGDTMYMNMQGRSMKVPMPKGALSQWRDPAKLAQNQATMSVESLGRDSVDGVSARKYVVHNTQPKPTDVTMWIDEKGLPLQIRHTSNAEGKTVDVTIRYTRFNDPSIRIDPPQ